MKRLISLITLLAIPCTVYADPHVSSIRQLEFGTVTYTDDNTGKQMITVPSSASVPTTSGNGNMKNPTFPAGTLSRSLVYLDGFDSGSKQKLDAKVNNTSGTWTTSGCGTVSISSINLWTTKPESAKGKTTATLAVGASVQLTSFTGTGTCTISGTLTGALGWRIQNTGNYQDADFVFSLTVIGSTSLEHNTGAQLDFGTICTSTSAQTLIVTPDSTLSPSSTNVCPTSVTADSFTFSNPDSVSFSVTVPNSATLTNTSNSATLTANNFTYSCNGSCTTSSGSKTFTVGATLNVPASPSPGDYVGSYSVSVTY